MGRSLTVKFTLVCIFFLCGITENIHAQEQNEIRKSIYFGGGSYYIDKEQTDELMHWVESIPDLLEKYEVRLLSHTDPIGGKEYNEWLSKMRGQAVFDLLVEIGVPNNIIHIKEWGLDNPLYNNNTQDGREMNRRVDVILHPIVF